MRSLRFFLPLLVALLLAACSGQRPREVHVTAPVLGDLEAVYIASGEVASTQVRVSAERGGRIRSIPVEQNQEVGRGEVLAFLDDEEQRARVAGLRSSLEVARSRSGEAVQAVEVRRVQDATAVRRASAALEEAQWRLKAAEKGPQVEEIRRARSGVAAAEAELSRARSERDRLEQLFRQDVVSEAQVEGARVAEKVASERRDQAASSLRQLEAGTRHEDLQAARARVQQSRLEVEAARERALEQDMLRRRAEAAAAELRNLESQLREAEAVMAKMVVKSPGKGVVSQIFLGSGEVARPGEPILSLVLSDELWIDALVDEQDAAAVALHQPVRVRFSSFPGREFTGRVGRVAPSLEDRPGGSGRALRVRVEMEGEIPDLKPGLEADVEGRQALAREALLVPRSAVLQVEGKDYVVGVRDGKAVRLPVKIGAATADRVQILDGLEPGTPVVVDGQDLPEGTAVRGAS